MKNMQMQTFIFYSSLFLLSLFFCWLGEKNKSKSKIAIFLAIFPLWFINVFRSMRVGTDYINVGNTYYNIVMGSYNNNYNWFWFPLRIFCKIIGLLFGPNPFVFYFFIGTMTMYFLYKIIIKSENKTFSLFLFIVFGLYLQSFNQSRQILALIIILYALFYINDKNNKIKYFLLVALASVFHESALIFVPLYFLKNIKINKKVLTIYCISALVLLVSNNILVSIISHTKYVIYFSSQYNLSNVKTTLLNLCVRIILLIFCMKSCKEDLEKNFENNIVYNYCMHMAIICCILQFLVTKYYFLGRLTTYFYAFYVILLPKAICNFYKKFKQNEYLIIVKITIIIVLLLYFYIYYSSPSGSIGSGYDVYSFIFN